MWFLVCVMVPCLQKPPFTQENIPGLCWAIGHDLPSCPISVLDCAVTLNRDLGHRTDRDWPRSEDNFFVQCRRWQGRVQYRRPCCIENDLKFGVNYCILLALDQNKDKKIWRNKKLRSKELWEWRNYNLFESQNI